MTMQHEILFRSNAESYVAQKILVEHPGQGGMIEKRLGIEFNEKSESRATFTGTPEAAETLRVIFDTLADLVSKEEVITKAVVNWALDDIAPKQR